MKRSIATAAAALALACSGHEVAPGSVEGPERWGGADVTRVSHLYFSGQPDRDTLERARSEGVTLVVNLRAPAESGYWEGEPAAARELGLRYVNVPVPGGAPFSREAFARVEELVKEQDHAPVLVHCSSGNRAAAWLAAHLAEEHEMDVEQSLAVARRAGITKPEIESGVRAYLGDGS